MPWAHARSADTDIPTVPATGGTPLLDEKAYASLMAKCWRCQAAEPVHPTPGAGLCEGCIEELRDDGFSRPVKAHETERFIDGPTSILGAH